MKLGFPEKSIFGFFALVVTIIIIVAGLLFQTIGLSEAFFVPPWQLLIFAIIVFLFLGYIMDKLAPVRTLLKRAAIMFAGIVVWSFLQSLFAFLAAEDKSFGHCVTCSFSSLPIFLLNLTFVILLSYMTYKLFSTPILRTLGTPKEETLSYQAEPGLPKFTSEDELAPLNPFEFHPDPLLSFEDLPGFFTRKVKGLIGCVIFDADEGLVMASALPPGFNPESLSAGISNIISESKDTVNLFTSKPMIQTNTIIFLPQRIIAFAYHRDYSILLIFDESVSPAYVKRSLEALPEVLKEFTRGKTYLQKEATI